MLIDRTKITFWFDDVCSEDIGIRVIDFPTFTGAEKRVTTYTIPGRNGDLTYWDGSFGNVSCEINCFIVSADKIDEALTAVNGWLAGSGYKRFAISSELGRYRMARITNAADIAIRMGVIAPFTIKLDCKPQRFFDEEGTITLPSTGGTVYNPTPFTSQPIMRCFMKDQFTLLAEEINIGTSKVRISGTQNLKNADWVDIDFDTKMAKNSLGNDVPVESFESPGLAPGENSITTSYDSFFSGFEILPRWWTL